MALKGIIMALNLLYCLNTSEQKQCRFEVKEIQNQYYHGIILYPANFSGNIECTKLSMHNTKFNIIKSDAFRGFSNLEDITLSNNGLQNLSNGTFKDLKLLKTLSVIKNCLKSLSNDIFIGLVSLTTLNLECNNIQTLKRETFIYLISLYKLHLQNNIICKIERGAFKGLITLYTLYLQNNNLTHITKGLIKDLTNLVKLDLSDNPIQSIEQGAFVRSLPILSTVKIDLRNINTLELSWLIFPSSPSSSVEMVNAVNAFGKTILYLSKSSGHKCARSICWMNHLGWKHLKTYGIQHLYTDLDDLRWLELQNSFKRIHSHRNTKKYFGNLLKETCDEKLNSTCPNKGNDLQLKYILQNIAN